MTGNTEEPKQAAPAQKIAYIQRVICDKAQEKYEKEVATAVENLRRVIQLNQLAKKLNYEERAAWAKRLNDLVKEATEATKQEVRVQGAKAFLQQFETLITSIPEMQDMARMEGYYEGQADASQS